jgi:hypothetical protein
MKAVGYMQRVGHSRCVRCDFETRDDMSFEEQDAAMMIHLEKMHPDWMFPKCDVDVAEMVPASHAIKDQIVVKETEESIAVEKVKACQQLYEDYKAGGYCGTFDRWLVDLLAIERACSRKRKS